MCFFLKLFWATANKKNPTNLFAFANTTAIINYIMETVIYVRNTLIFAKIYNQVVM